MALGKQIGTSEYKTVSTTYIPGLGGTVTAQINLEGAVSGEISGPVQGTMTVENLGGQSGTWSLCAGIYPADGKAIFVGGQGTWETAGTYQWRLKGLGQLPDGRTVAAEGRAEMANRTVTFKIYEWSGA
jgi:hypothetical protein